MIRTHGFLWIVWVVALGLALVASLGLAALAPTEAPVSAQAQALDPTPPTETVRLIFIHHSTGENWLTDDYGDLGRVLGENNYFVSDTNYGWGPDGVGDTTDIVDWPRWFRSADSPRYLAALFAESGQNSGYTRNLSNPGGENEIVMFKSCFPNSALEGSPNDPPSNDGYLTVGYAKVIYNDLLNYFITRPDKLFVVITAPPLQDATYAANARAFNTWLTRDWLAENNYPYSNVAVFDFYNVLTHPDNHHRFRDGQIEYVINHGNNTLYYPSDDDHPSVQGSRKATAEFIPLLNVFYHRWKAQAEVVPVDIQEGPSATDTPTGVDSGSEPPVEAVVMAQGLVDNFDGDPPFETDGWVAYWDESPGNTFSCAPQEGQALSGGQALHIQYDLVLNGWATCGLYYWNVRDWSAASGVSFALRASQPGLTFDVHVYGGTPENQETYYVYLAAPPESLSGWARVTLAWEQFTRVEWEENAGAPLDPARITGMGFGFSYSEEKQNQGAIWVDDIQLLSFEAVQPQPVIIGEPTLVPVDKTQPEMAPTEPPAPSPSPTEAESEGETRRPFACPGSLMLGGLALGLFYWSRKRS